MGKSCAIIPKVKNKNGELVDSKLFKSLLKYTNNDRTESNRIYLITKSNKFINEWVPKLTLDDNSEPTISSLLKKTNLSTVIPESKIIERLNRDIGYYKRGDTRPALYANTDKNYNELLQKAISFNQNSDMRDDYVANIVRIQDNESHREFINVRVDRRNRLNSVNADKMAYNYHLNNRIRELLSSWGISIGALTDLEKRLGINGVTDFDVAKTSVDGLIEMIRIASGIRGEKALPEEFAHFVIEAMGNNPLINRLINNLHNSGLVSSILGNEYDTYNTLYNGDQAKMAKEAAGKLLAEHFLKTAPYNNKPYKGLLSRVIEAVRTFLKRLSISDLERARLSADRTFGSLASDILSGSMNSQISVNNITSSDRFYNTSERITRDKALLNDIIAQESKRLNIYGRRNPNGKFTMEQKLIIDKLQLDLAENNEIEGIYSFSEHALNQLQQLSNRMSVIINTPVSDINDRAGILRDVRNYIYSYGSIADDIRKALVDEERYKDNRYGQRVRVVLDNISIMINDLKVTYNSAAMPLFEEYITPFLGNGIKVLFGKYKGKVLTAKELLKIADHDISFFDRWLDSMADSSDPILRIMDQATKKVKESARLRTIDVIKEIQAATIELEQSGIKNTEWMFEKNADGKATGRNYVSEINWSLYIDNRNKMLDALNKKYGKDPVGDDVDRYKEDRRRWYDENTEIVNGERKPKLSIYENKDFARLNSAQKRYYNTIMGIKSQLDSFLPARVTSLYNAVKIRKDLIERVLSSDNITSGLKQVWESIKDEFIRRSDNSEFGADTALTDFEDDIVQSLPIYYIRMKDGESTDDISLDVASTLSAYAAMAIDYDEMSKVIDVLELGRDLLKDRRIAQTNAGNPLVERIKSFGTTIERKLTKPATESRFFERLNDYFTMQIYGRYMADEGTFGNTKVDKGKFINFINRMTSINNLAVNVLAGISNVATGKVMMRIEAFAGEFFNEKNVIKADRIYGKYLPLYLAQIGNRIKTDKISLWNELFNVMQDYETDVREMNFDRKTWFTRMFGTSALFFMNNAGEHWMQTRTSLALADAYKMKSPDGKIVSLWDAMEVVPLDPNNKSRGARLQLKEGYTKADGTAFTKEDIIKFSRKSAAINQRMHGIYNRLDRSAVQRLAVGRMGVMFRKWIKPSLNRRFKSASYNFDLDSWTEGYYLTTGKFLFQLAKDIRETQFNLAARWKELTPTEKANIRRAITETSHFLAVAAILGMIEWSDDDDRPWLVSMLEYQARRLYTEVGAMIPGQPMLTEGLKILESPAAGINTLERLLDLTKLLNPYNYTDELKSGRYEGHSTAYKTFFESPVIPMNRTIYRGLHPETGIPFFKQ